MEITSAYQNLNCKVYNFKLKHGLPLAVLLVEMVLLLHRDLDVEDHHDVLLLLVVVHAQASAAPSQRNWQNLNFNLKLNPTWTPSLSLSLPVALVVLVVLVVALLLSVVGHSTGNIVLVELQFST